MLLAMGGAPYRGGVGAPSASSPDETGLVADLIAQFADRLAFYRELVQNAIDAGSVSIGVRIAWEPGTCVVSVRDVGVGMSREVIEEELLVLFRSGKEGQEGAIGKFGVGFVSVLAVDPEVVEVHTSTGDGTAHVLHLRRDQSWDLFEVDGGSTAGSTVKLRIPMASDTYGQFVADSDNALERWCCHARVPIHLTASDLEGEMLIDERIDRPLDLEGALVSVDVSDGDTQLVVGLHPDGESFAGFYNGGLMLFETTDSLVGPVMFKVQDAHLEHTLSRDNVRRDAAFARALRRVREAVQKQLSAAVIDALVHAASSDRRRYRALIDAVHPKLIDATAKQWRFPVLSPIRGRASVEGSALRGLYATTRGPLIDALAAKGVPVLDAEGLDDAGLDALGRLVSHAVGVRPRDAYLAFTAVLPVPLEGYDDALLSALADLLETVARAPSSVHFARLVGVRADRFCIAGGTPADPWILEDETADDPLRLIARPALVLNADHALCRAARAAMEIEPEVAVAFLARAVLVQTGRLNEKADEALTTAALTGLLGTAG